MVLGMEASQVRVICIVVSVHDGFVSSGFDSLVLHSDIYLFDFSWMQRRILQKYKAHDKGPTIACVWHPLEPSVVFTCGWDGMID